MLNPLAMQALDHLEELHLMMSPMDLKKFVELSELVNLEQLPPLAMRGIPRKIAAERGKHGVAKRVTIESIHSE
jgi:hypothetical protein